MSLKGAKMLSLSDKHQLMEKEAEEALVKVKKTKKVALGKAEVKKKGKKRYEKKN